MALPTVTVTPGTGVTINTLPAAGQSTAANSIPVVLASDAGVPAGTNTIGNVGHVTTTTGGATPFHLLSANTVNSTSVKGSAGQLYSVQLVNRNTTTAAYVKFYNKATAPTVGTDVPVKTFCLPAAAAVTQPTVLVHAMYEAVTFSSGIGLAVTAGTGLDADTTAVGTNDVTCDFNYK